jgi:hypothetical protein
MHIKRRGLFILITSLAFILIAGAVVVGQVGGAETCPDLVTRALAAVNNLCAGQERNSACYGNTLVQAEFAGDGASVAFAQEGDIANLGLLRAIRTSPLNDELTEWGVSVLSVQANLPGTLPGQNALFMLIGGAEIESAVQPQNAFTPSSPVPVASAAATQVSSAPQAGAAAAFFVEAGQSLLADAKSEDGAFVRVTLGEQFGWIDAAALQPDAAIDALPVYTPGTSFSPMQAFYLRTGVGGANCTQAPSALVVQGPEAFNVQINANGADISLGSSVILETLPIDESKIGNGKYQGQPGVGGLLRITVIDGMVTITNDDGTVTEIPEGYQSTICLTEPQNLGSDGEQNDQTVTYLCGGWTEPEQIPPEFREQFSLVDDFPLNYALDILTPVPTFAPPPVVQASATPVPPTPAPTETPWPFIPSDTPVPPSATPMPVGGLEIAANVELVPDMGTALVPRFLGLGGNGFMWSVLLDLSVTNAGQTTATDIVISDPWPDGVEGYGEPDTGFIDEETYAWVIDALEPGQTASYMGDGFVILDCGGSISAMLTISANSTEPFPPVFSYSAVAECAADIDVSVYADLYPAGSARIVPRFLGLGQGGDLWLLILDVYVYNYGLLDAENLVLSGIYPPGIEGSGETSQGTFDSDTNTWTIGNLASGQVASLGGAGYVTLSCGGSVSSTIAASADTPLAFAGPWGYSRTANCGPQETPEVLPQAALEITPETTPEATAEATPEVTSEPVEATAETTPEVTQSPE